MSEKRFERWNDYSCKVKDNQEDILLSWEDVVKKLNEQQEHITHLEDTNDNFRIKLIEDIEAMEQAEKKIGEQQALINELQSIINHCERKTESGKKMNEEPVYYNLNGLSPNQAFEQGLISNEEFIGFIKGNVIKYVVRCDKKGNPIEDIDKAISYLRLLKKIMMFDDG